MTSFIVIRPYPEKIVCSAQLKNGDVVQLRLIKPEDEPLWLEMLRNCSMDTLHRRFGLHVAKELHAQFTRSSS